MVDATEGSWAADSLLRAAQNRKTPGNFSFEVTVLISPCARRPTSGYLEILHPRYGRLQHPRQGRRCGYNWLESSTPFVQGGGEFCTASRHQVFASAGVVAGNTEATRSQRAAAEVDPILTLLIRLIRARRERRRRSGRSRAHSRRSTMLRDRQPELVRPSMPARRRV